MTRGEMLSCLISVAAGGGYRGMLTRLRVVRPRRLASGPVLYYRYITCLDYSAVFLADARLWLI